MTPQELRELDAWIAELMEAKPESIPLHRARKYNDDRFNYARQNSSGGWWITNTGMDAEDKRGINTPCVWYPSSNIASEPSEVESRSAALLVLEKCRCVDSVHLMPPTPDAPCEIWGVGCRAKADTLPLAIALFAKQLFSK